MTDNRKQANIKERKHNDTCMYLYAILNFIEPY